MYPGIELKTRTVRNDRGEVGVERFEIDAEAQLIERGIGEDELDQEKLTSSPGKPIWTET